MAVNVVTLPLLLRYLDPLRYGIWVTISTTVVMLAVLDLGIASTLTNHVAKARVSNDLASARAYYATAFWVTLIFASAIALAISAVMRFVDWRFLFNLHSLKDARDTEWCVVASMGFFLLNLPLSLANRVLAGYQLVHVSNYFGMINSILSSFSIVLGILLHLSLPMLMTFYCGAMLLGTMLLNVWLWLVRKPHLLPNITQVQKKAGIDLLSSGSLFFLLQITGLVVFNSDNLIITHYVGAAEVTPYSTAWKLFGYASILNSLFLPSLWSAYADAHHAKDVQWLKQKYASISKLNALSVSTIAILLALGARTIIRVWAGAAAVPSLPVVWCMALWAVLYSITTNQAVLFAATQRLRVQASAAVIASTANLALSIYLVPRIGAIGAIIGSIASYVAFILAPQSLEVRRILFPAGEARV